jgi:drug/metabolite transporter (DMT)-like permease
VFRPWRLPTVKTNVFIVRGKEGIFYAVLATFCLSLSPVLVKAALEQGIDPIALLTLRMVVGAAILWVLFSILFSRILWIDRRGFFACCLVAGANALSMFCYYFALTRISVSLAHVIFSLYPALALLLLATAGERIGTIGLIRLALALVGVFLLIGPGGRPEGAGVALVLVTAFLYALHLNLTQWFLSEYDPRTVSLYVVSIMALIMVPFYLCRFRGWQELSMTGWIVVLVTGLLSTALARFAMFSAIQRIGSGQMALLGPAETLLTVLWAMIFLGENLSIFQWAGGLLILFSASLARQRQDAMDRGL